VRSRSASDALSGFGTCTLSTVSPILFVSASTVLVAWAKGRCRKQAQHAALVSEGRPQSNGGLNGGTVECRRPDGADLRLAVMSAVSDQTALRTLTVVRALQPRERLASSVLKL
jgi:hypothetical protein